MRTIGPAHHGHAPEARKELDFILVDSIEDVLAVAFEKPAPVRAERAPRPERQAALPA